MPNVRTVEPGTSTQESAITLLRDAAAALLRHPRDGNAQKVASRITGLLSRFPTHFVVEYLAKTDTGAELRRVPLSDWPDWSDGLARRLNIIDGDGTGEALPPIDAPLAPVPLGEEDPAGPDHDAMVPGTGEDALEAIQAIAERLGVPCTAEEIDEAISELEAMADAERRGMVQNMRATEALRTLWLVVRKAPGATVLLERSELENTDWSVAGMHREDDLATGGTRLRALVGVKADLGPLLDDDA